MTLMPPHTGEAPTTQKTAPLLDVHDLCVDFQTPQKRIIHAVSKVSLTAQAQQSLGIVGESGSGKSTLGRAILQLLRPTSGEVHFDGQNLAGLWERRFGRWQWQRALVDVRQHAQMVFQDPYASLNPRMSVEAIIGEPLIIHRLAQGAALQARVAALLAQVGLDPSAMRRLPHAFSGGQRQRIGIARALATSPKLVIADEPISALDVSIQAQILNLLDDLKHAFGLTLVFIAHDLSAVRYLCDRVLVLFAGRVVEEAATQHLFTRPQHPYTQALLKAAPTGAPVALDDAPYLVAKAAEADKAQAEGPHCAYRMRCPWRVARCDSETPSLRTVGDGHKVACHVARPLPHDEKRKA